MRWVRRGTAPVDTLLKRLTDGSGGAAQWLRGTAGNPRRCFTAYPAQRRPFLPGRWRLLVPGPLPWFL